MLGLSDRRCQRSFLERRPGPTSEAFRLDGTELPLSGRQATLECCPRCQQGRHKKAAPTDIQSGSDPRRVKCSSRCFVTMLAVSEARKFGDSQEKAKPLLPGSGTPAWQRYHSVGKPGEPFQKSSRRMTPSLSSLHPTCSPSILLPAHQDHDFSSIQRRRYQDRSRFLLCPLQVDGDFCRSAR